LGLHSLLLRSLRCAKIKVGWVFVPDPTKAASSQPHICIIIVQPPPSTRCSSRNRPPTLSSLNITDYFLSVCLLTYLLTYYCFIFCFFPLHSANLIPVSDSPLLSSVNSTSSADSPLLSSIILHPRLKTYLSTNPSRQILSHPGLTSQTLFRYRYF